MQCQLNTHVQLSVLVLVCLILGDF